MTISKKMPSGRGARAGAASGSFVPADTWEILAKILGSLKPTTKLLARETPFVPPLHSQVRGMHIFPERARRIRVILDSMPE